MHLPDTLPLGSYIHILMLYLAPLKEYIPQNTILMGEPLVEGLNQENPLLVS